MRHRLAGVVAALSVVAGLVSVGALPSSAVTGDQQRPAWGVSSPNEPLARKASPRRVRVEFALKAKRARYTPTAAGANLKVERIAPRMSMMEIAPGRHATVVPASFLAGNWRRLFKHNGGVTNGILSARDGREHIAVPVRLRLRRHAPNGEQMAFAMVRLKNRGGHSGPVLGRKIRHLEDVSLLIDPTVTDQIKSLWASLMALFTTEPDVPANPTDRTTTSNFGTLSFNSDGSYAGDEGQRAGSPADWQRAQLNNLEASGSDFSMDPSAPRPVVDINGGNGVALFNHDFGDIAVSNDISRFALFESTADRVSFFNADVAGANMRGLVTDGFSAKNSALNGVDLTGSAIRPDPSQGDTRGSVSNSVFANVETNRDIETANGTLDRASSNKGLIVQNTDFVSTSFQNVDFSGAEVTGATFQGSGFMNVDFSDARISGPDPNFASDGKFQPTFDNSVFDDVKFDNARIENVSFAGVDLSGGEVSMAGATLSNVDFTGAVGLQNIDWTKVTVEGNVYGLVEYSHEVALDDPTHIRSMTFDGLVPEIDPTTGLDIEPATGWLIDTASGARLQLDESTGALFPIDPNTSGFYEDPRTGDYLQLQGELLVNPATGEEFAVNYETGEIE